MMRRLLFLVLGFFILSESKAITCLPGWKYTAPITVTNTNAGGLSYFQVKVIVNTQALIAAGKMKSTGDDIRFTDANCNNLHYWIDSNLNTTTTVIWVKVLSIPGSGNVRINLYYGNNCAAAAQSGDSTFVFFDDFSGGSLNTGKWNNYKTTPGSGAVGLAGGLATISTTGATDNVIRSVTTYTSPLRLESKVVANSGDYLSLAQLNTGTFNGIAVAAGTTYGANFTFNSAAAAGASYSVAANSAGVARANGVWGNYWNATNSAGSILPGGGSTIGTTPTLAASVHLAMGIASSGVGSITADWVRARKYAANDPTHSVGAEVAQSVGVKFYPTTICPGGQVAVVISKKNVYFNLGNQYIVELSDASGSFASPTNLGNVNDTIPDTVFYEIPMGITPGANYKIRVSTTSPAYNCFVADSSLSILSKPTPAFSFLNDNQCYKYNRYYFTSTSTVPSGTISNYIWNWNDGSFNDTLTTNTVNHHFKYFNTYFLVELTVVGSNGCRDILTKQVNLREMPSIVTEFNDDVQCNRGNFFIIKSASFAYTASITSTSWLFGDGSPMVSGVDSTTHKYATDGLYFVNQINSLSNGCIDTGLAYCVVNPHPIAAIITNDTNQCLVNNNFVFEANTSISNGLPIINTWTIDAGVEFTPKDSVHHRYATQGNRTIQLISVTDDGLDACSDTVEQVILVSPMPKTSITNFDNTLCLNGNNFRFKAKSTIPSGTVAHNWTFGDAGTATALDSTAHAYATAGTYTVEVKGISNYGCRDSAKTTIIVNPSPVAGFTINNKIQCLKTNQFKLKSTSSITSGTYTRSWLMSDGSSFSGVDSIETEFATIGTYAAKLLLVSNKNCKDSIIDSLKVLPMPSPSFIINNDQQCFRGNSFDFTDNSFFSAGTITSNLWSFDDGNTASNTALVNHKYLIEGEFNVRLIVYGDNGCSDTMLNKVYVYPHPATDFAINNPAQCVNNNRFVFTTNTFISDGSFTNRWYFGDGSPFSSVFDNVQKKYTKDSTYLITNIAFSDHSCSDTAYKTVTVYPKPKTGFTIDNDKQCRLNNSFNFTSTSTIKAGTYTLAWSYGDGNIDGNVATTQHSYANAQLYKARLIATSNNNCLDTTIKDVRVYPMPVASFVNNYPSACIVGNNFTFTATSTLNPNTGMIHNWYFGDQDSAKNTSPTSHIYNTPGSFRAKLVTISTTGNCIDSITKTLQVFPMPVPSFSIDNDKQCLLNNDFNFASTSTIATGTIASYYWTFGDNSTATTQNTSHTYLNVDSLRVSLILTSDNGCIDSTYRMAQTYAMPVADFTVTPRTSCLDKNSFKFVNRSKITKGSFGTFEWSFGDNSTSTLKDPPPYSYTAHGTYIITLKAISNKGCWDTANISVDVNPNPILDFDVDSVCLKDSSVFVNKSTNPSGLISSWKWTFGDGLGTSTLESPKYKYRRVGSFDISLTAITDKGCKDNLTKTAFAKVNPLPTARFEYHKIRSWENEVDIQYADSSIGANSWFWNFSQMGTSTQQNPFLLYTDTVTQPTTLIVTNQFGCRDTTTKILFIAPDVIYYMPNAFSPGNDDNINDFFKPKGLSYAQSYRLVIFNRWGEILFDSRNPQEGWDGKYENELVEQGVYFYRLEFVGVDELRHKEEGNIMILR
ncbi:MAG: DUF2341 domain-containing protein [Bacteroidota bacterium]